MGKRPLLSGEIEEWHPVLDFTKKDYMVGFMLDTLDDKEKIVKELFIKSEDGLTHVDEFKLRLKKNNVPEFPLRISKELLAGNCFIPLPKDRSEYIKMAFDEIRKLYKRHIDFSEKETYDFITAWSLATYFFPMFYSFPYVHIHGLSNTGKTKSMEIGELVCFNSVACGNMSEPVLFRIVENWRPTLFIDETDALAKKANRPTFRELLLNGNKKFGKAWRSIKKDQAASDYDPKPYEVYSPKMLANIDGLDDVLGSRAIRITMWRSKSDKYSEEINPDDLVWQETRDMCYMAIFKAWDMVKSTYENMEREDDIINRNWELWKPILTISSLVGNDIYKNILNFAKKRMKESLNMVATEAVEYKLVKALFRICFEDKFFNLKDIKIALQNEFEQGEGAWITSHWTSKTMEKIGFKVVRECRGYKQYFIQKEFLDELMERLGIKEDDITPLEDKKISNLSDKIIEFVRTKGRIKRDDVIHYFVALGIIEDFVDKKLDIMKREGMLFEPQVGMIECP